MAAPLGFKTFTVGEVLSAADVNGYLMQGVLVFATTAARDAAITSPQEGQFAFTKDTNSLFYYDGAAWVASGAAGDIEGVTAGTGISGGGTSGTVTVTNSMATAIDAKGDLIVGTGADTFSRLAVSATNGHTLVADSAEATGLKWAAPAGGGGKVLQVVQDTLVGGLTTTSTSYVDSGLTLSITPVSVSSRILVMVNIVGMNPSTSQGAGARIMRDSTEIYFTDVINLGIGNTTPVSFMYVDSPSTTSAITYKAQAKNTQAGILYLGNYYSQTNPISSIIAMEIGA